MSNTLLVAIERFECICYTKTELYMSILFILFYMGFLYASNRFKEHQSPPCALLAINISSSVILYVSKVVVMITFKHTQHPIISPNLPSQGAGIQNP